MNQLIKFHNTGRIETVSISFLTDPKQNRQEEKAKGIAYEQNGKTEIAIRLGPNLIHLAGLGSI